MKYNDFLIRVTLFNLGLSLCAIFNSEIHLFAACGNAIVGVLVLWPLISKYY
jgi:hypothetical protein